MNIEGVTALTFRSIPLKRSHIILKIKAGRSNRPTSDFPYSEKKTTDSFQWPMRIELFFLYDDGVQELYVHLQSSCVNGSRVLFCAYDYLVETCVYSLYIHLLGNNPIKQLKGSLEQYNKFPLELSTRFSYFLFPIRALRYITDCPITHQQDEAAGLSFPFT